MSLVVVQPVPCSDIDGEYAGIVDRSESNGTHMCGGA